MSLKNKTRKNHKSGKGNSRGRVNSSVKKGRGKIVLRKGLKKLAKRLPDRYFKPLSPKDQKKQLQQLDKSRKMYRQDKYHTRAKLASFKSRPSRHVVDFKKCYGISVTSDLGLIEKKTGVPIEVCSKILNKGRGAYYSSGSRPNQTAESWARARLASAILKRGAYRVDKHLFPESAVIKKCIKHGT